MEYTPSFWNFNNRRKAVDFALNVVRGTRLEPKAYERMLLEQFVQGELSLEQVELYLEGESTLINEPTTPINPRL